MSTLVGNPLVVEAGIISLVVKFLKHPLSVRTGNPILIIYKKITLDLVIPKIYRIIKQKNDSVNDFAECSNASLSIIILREINE